MWPSGGSGGGGGTNPSITNLSPSSGAVGTSVTITGTNFGSSQGSSTVTFAGTAASPTSWSATSIVAPVPAGATNGNVVVTVSGASSNGVNFTVSTIGVSVSPQSITLVANQTQQFTATVSGTSDQDVTWAINPAVGSISSSGLYTAPSTISSGQTVTVTATSVADTSAAGSALVGFGAGVYYYLEDELGTSRVIADPSGNICYDADFYPFGGVRPVVDSCQQNYKFTGKERDPESAPLTMPDDGLDNSAARYYSSLQGRFMSPDPVNAGADPSNPQSWNMYSYVNNNPLSFIDPFGLDCISANGNGDLANWGDALSETACGNANNLGNGNEYFYVPGSVSDSQWNLDSGTLSVDFNQNGFGTSGTYDPTTGQFSGGYGDTLFDWSNYASNPSSPNPSSSDAQLLQAVAKGINMAARAIPTVCGGGLFEFAGGSNISGIVEYDTQSRLSSGVLAEKRSAGFAGLATQHGPTGEALAFGGEGAGPFGGLSKNGEASVGVWAGAKIPGTNLGIGGGAYVNVTNAAACQ